MKHFICALLIVCTCISFAQNTDNKSYKSLEFNFDARFGVLYPIQFGNTALAEAHKPRIGFLSHLNFLKYDNFKAGIGFDFVTYDITDKEMIANLSTSKYTSAYLIIGYQKKLKDKLFITPHIGFGPASLELGSRGSRFGKQNGNEFRIGGILDYKITKSGYVYLGIDYIASTLDVATAPEYESYFSKANQIQMSLGIRLGN